MLQSEIAVTSNVIAALKLKILHVYHSHWHTLTPDHIETLFKAHLTGLSAFPYNLLPELRKLEIATLGVVEDRELSTKYLIRETDQYYFSPKEMNDQAKTSYKIKTPPFVISEDGENCFIERLKSPKFKAKYDPVSKELFDIEWLESESSQITLISTLRKASGFLRERVK